MKPFRDFLRGLWSNRISIFGVALTTVSALIIIISIFLNILDIKFSPYQNLVAYVFFLLMFIIGLALMPIGAWLWRKKGHHEEDGIVDPLKIDFSNPTHVRGVLFFIAMSALNVIIFSVVFYKTYHFTESNTFCGTLCHTVMYPEYKAHSRSPHSRVNCVDCHIGSGASWFVKAKISGIWQVIAVLTGSYERPIPSPVENLRPARDTCEQCHWPQVFHGNRLKIYKRLNNEDVDINDPRITIVSVNIGGLNTKTGKFEGIHWHVGDQNKVEYQAVDKKRRKIKRVRVTDGKTGKVTEFVKKEIKDPKGIAEWRTMDCIDCHNRPTHIYDIPEDAVDRLLLDGKMTIELPDIRKISLKSLKGKYKSQAEAKKGMLVYFKKFYAENHKDIAESRKKDIENAALMVYTIYENNVFPKMNVNFGTYLNHIGHKHDNEVAGCFRCHDDEHEDKDGNTIAQDCDKCHSILAEDEKISKLDENMKQLLKHSN